MSPGPSKIPEGAIPERAVPPASRVQHQRISSFLIEYCALCFSQSLHVDVTISAGSM